MEFQYADGSKVIISEQHILDALLKRPKTAFRSRSRIGSRKASRKIIQRIKNNRNLNRTEVLKKSNYKPYKVTNNDLSNVHNSNDDGISNEQTSFYAHVEDSKTGDNFSNTVMSNPNVNS